MQNSMANKLPRRLLVFFACAAVLLGVSTAMAAPVQVDSSDYKVDVFFTDAHSDTYFSTSSPVFGKGRVIYNSSNFYKFGFRVTLPASDVACSIAPVGFFTCYAKSSTNTNWHNVAPSGLSLLDYEFFVSSVSIPSVFPGSDFLLKSGASIVIPPHSSPLYLFALCQTGSSGAKGVYTEPNASVLVETSPWIALQASINQISGKLDIISESAGGPMQKFENEYVQKFQGQLDKTEQALSPTNPALPNNGDVGGFTHDIQETMGINGSSFDAQEFSEAVSGISGAASVDDGGIWQFFTQQVADDLATPSGSARDVPKSPEDELEEYIKASEGWLSKW